MRMDHHTFAFSGSGWASRINLLDLLPFPRTSKLSWFARRRPRRICTTTEFEAHGSHQKHRNIHFLSWCRSQHVYNQIVVTKCRTTFTNNELVISGLQTLMQNMAHFMWCKELCFLMLMMASVFAIASTKSVWRLKNAGSWIISATSATGAAW